MVLDLLAIEDEIESGRAIPIKGTFSAAESFIVTTNQGKFFRKQYQVRNNVKDASKDAQVADTSEFNRMVYSLPATANIEINIPLETKVASEVMATLRWRNLGLPTQDLVHYDGQRTIIFRFVDGYSFDSVLNGPQNSQAFDKVLDSLHNIRRKAIEFNDPNVLHSDPYSNNFFYDQVRGIVVPFDSSKINKRKMSFDEIDARLYLFFLCKIFLLKTDSKTHRHYVKQAVDRLSRNERRVISDLYIDPREQREYFESQNLQEGNIIDIYYRIDIRNAIQDVLKKT